MLSFCFLLGALNPFFPVGFSMLEIVWPTSAVVEYTLRPHVQTHIRPAFGCLRRCLGSCGDILLFESKSLSDGWVREKPLVGVVSVSLVRRVSNLQLVLLSRTLFG